VGRPRGWVGLEVIAVFKIVKAIGLIIIALGTFGLINDRWADLAESWLASVVLSEGHHFLSTLAAKAIKPLSNASLSHLIEIGVGALLYAALFLVEGIGLWRCKRWAEYLTVIATSSFLPFEIVALAHKVTMVRVGAVLINAAVVAYLIWQIRATRFKNQATGSFEAGT
jgi:uncharacterized membrane protein (DUF2068 family)